MVTLMNCVSAIVVNFNGGAMNIACIDSLLAEGAFEVIVVDNNSTDGSPELLVARYRDERRVRMLRNTCNVGFSAACNQASAVASGALLFFFNNDAVCEPNCILELSQALERDGDAGIVGPIVLEKDAIDIVQSSLLTIDFWGYAFDPTNGKSAHLVCENQTRGFFVSGCALMIRAELFKRLKGFDDGMFMFCEDIDLCWRAQLLGYQVKAITSARCCHAGGATAKMGQVADKYVTSSFRISHREQNAFRMMCVNLGGALLIAYILFRFPAVVCEAIAMAICGRWNIAAAYGIAFLRIGEQLASTVRRRRAVQRQRVCPDKIITQHWSRRYEKWRSVRRIGIPSLSVKNT